MKQELKKQEHIYGIDLLRILCMFMICLVHVLGNGGVLEACQDDRLRKFLVYFLEAASYCCVDCYALISGYVGLNAGRKYTNIVMLWIEVVFYNIIITALFANFMPGSVGQNEIMAALLPLTYTRARWYFKAYVGLFFLMPMLNAAIKKLPRRRMAMLTVFYTAFVIFLTLVDEKASDGQPTFGNNILLLSFLYLIGGYFREYGFPNMIKKQHWLICYGLLTVLLTAGITFGDLLPGKLSAVGNLAVKGGYNNSPITILATICLFAVFVNIKNVPCKKFVKTLGGLTFGIYIVHTDPLFYNLLLKDRFVWVADEPVVLTFLYPLLAAAAIFIISGCIEYLRSKLFGLLHIREGLQKLENRITTKVKL